LGSNWFIGPSFDVDFDDSLVLRDDAALVSTGSHRLAELGLAAVCEGEKNDRVDHLLIERKVDLVGNDQEEHDSGSEPETLVFLDGGAVMLGHLEPLSAAGD
jgi:hypothetical protein